MSFNLEVGILTKDLVITDENQLSIIDSPNYIAQKVESRLRFFQGEWFLNPSLGLPYFTDILIKTRDKDKVDAIFKNEILSTNGVLSIVDYVSELNRTTRTFSIITLNIEVSSNNVIQIGGINING